MKRYISVAVCALMACIIAVGVMYLDKPISVSAEETSDDGYTIPDNYECFNYVIDYYRDCSDNSARIYDYWYFDFDFFVPSGYKVVLQFPSSYKDVAFSVYSDSAHLTKVLSSASLTMKKGNVYIITVTVNDVTFPVFIRDNGTVRRYTLRYLDKNKQDKNVTLVEYHPLSDISSVFVGNGYWKINNVYCYVDSNYTETAKYKSYIIPSNDNYYHAYDSFKYASHIIESQEEQSYYSEKFEAVDNLRSSMSMVDVPNPKLKAARYNKDIGLIMMTYEYNEDYVPTEIDMYSNIFVKLKGVKDWVTLSNTYNSSKLASVALNVSYHNILGGLYISDVSDALSESEITGDVEAVIWGVRYIYGKNKTSYVFNRYVITDASIDNPDITIDDLGNLSDITTNDNNGTVTVKPGGSENNPTISEEVDVSTINGFLKSVDFDISSIGKAFTSLGGMVTGFATVIGNIFKAMFGNEITVLVTFGLGCLIILRVLAR